MRRELVALQRRQLHGAMGCFAEQRVKLSHVLSDASMHDQLTWAQAACGRAFRPLIRLALAMGLKHSHLEDLLRRLLLEEAARLWRAEGVAQPNISQLSITTGLNRKDVTARLRSPADPLPHSETSAPAKTLTLWLQQVGEQPELRRLPVTASSAGPSFEDLARRASRGDVHHRAILDELTRLGLCTEAEGHVELIADGFIPTGDRQTTLAFLGDNLRDHAAAAVSNTLGDAPLMLERTVFASGVTAADCAVIHQLARQRWGDLHRELVDEMTRAVDRCDGAGPQRIRVGIYVYHGDNDEAAQ